MIKAIFFDIDGTLVSFGTHKIPASALDALDALRMKGIKLIVATGRHISAINNLGGWDPDGYVTMNGSMCIAGDEVVYEKSIPCCDVDSLIGLLSTDDHFPCVFATKDELVMNYRNEVTDGIFESLDFPIVPAGSLEGVRGRKIYEILGFFTREKEDSVMRRLPGSHTMRWNPLFTDIVAKGVDKWSGILKMAGHYGIRPEEIMAFGDGGNDISMLQGAHISVAMGNAGEKIKRHADYVTAPVDEDGILKALRHYGIL